MGRINTSFQYCQGRTTMTRKLSGWVEYQCRCGWRMTVPTLTLAYDALVIHEAHAHYPAPRDLVWWYDD